MRLKKIIAWFKPRKSASPQTSPSLDIKEFVKNTLVGIMSGIRAAQAEYQNENSAYAPLISPAWGPPLTNLGGSTKGHADKIHDLEFDLAVTIDESSSATCNGKAGIKVAGLYTGGLGMSTESAGSHSTVSRIRFKIPVRYPIAALKPANWNIPPTTETLSLNEVK